VNACVVTFDELQKIEMIVLYATIEGATSNFSCHLRNATNISSTFKKKYHKMVLYKQSLLGIRAFINLIISYTYFKHVEILLCNEATGEAKYFLQGSPNVITMKGKQLT